MNAKEPTKNPAAIPNGYETRVEHPASRENSNPGGDRGYDHREIAPRDRRDIPPPPRPWPRTVIVNFREADFAACPCYR